MGGCILHYFSVYFESIFHFLDWEISYYGVCLGYKIAVYEISDFPVKILVEWEMQYLEVIHY